MILIQSATKYNLLKYACNFLTTIILESASLVVWIVIFSAGAMYEVIVGSRKSNDKSAQMQIRSQHLQSAQAPA
jgi:hypothetical protein